MHRGYSLSHKPHENVRLNVTQLFIPRIKIPPLSENIEVLYKLDYEQLLGKLKQAFSLTKENPMIKPLYEAYKSMMGILYSETNEEFFEDLFIRHTYMQLAVIASLSIALGKIGELEDICSGSLIGVEVALPYLNWWKTALHNKEAKNLIKDVLEVITTRANLVDWSLGTVEDVFRTLYEFLVESHIRRQLGEYYTPIWLVEMMINKFNVKGKIILDPFCGSGSFLVKAFYKKIELGENPDVALNEIVGFDINPLAISVARAELIIAYNKISGREPENPPHIYHVDTFAIWFGGYMIPFKGLEEIAKRAWNYLDVLVKFKQIKLGSITEMLATLRNLEKALTYAIRFAHNKCKLTDKCLEEEIIKYLEQNLENFRDDFTQRFLEHFKSENVIRTIAKLITEHGGNDVWAIVLMSIYIPILITGFKPDIIITNPPWIPITEYKASYSEEIRRCMLEKIKKQVRNKATRVLAGADIATVALAKSIKLANEGVAYIMNRDQLFNHNTSIPAGIIATYCILKEVLKDISVNVELFDFDFDVFQHGIYPSVIIIKKV